MSKKLSELLVNDSFVRFLKDQASEEEQARWSVWMKEKAENARLVEWGRRLINEGFQDLPIPEKDLEWRRLLVRIEAEQKAPRFYAIQYRHKKSFWTTMAVAAGIVLTIGLLGLQIYLQGNRVEEKSPSVVYRTMNTDYGERTAIRYSDGSKIVLNAHSQLRLPESVIGYSTVEVWLEGEALFDIDRKSSSNSRTFIVHTPNSDISVLGTEFAVNTSHEQTRIVLAEGRLQVISRDTSRGELNYEMMPGELALLSSKFEEIQVVKVNPEVYTSWASDSLVLDGTPLSDLIERIEFTYGVSVVVGDEALLKEKLSGRFGNLDLKFLLEGLSKTLDVNIERHKNTVYIKNNEPTGS